jgi:hypothetical protein
MKTSLLLGSYITVFLLALLPLLAWRVYSMLFEKSFESLCSKDVRSVWVKSVAGCGIPPPPPVWLTILGKSLTRPDLYSIPSTMEA